ncbi:MAG TPA: hypothetical protein VGF44_04945 [Terriglobales bacterium]|jgi:hypothetical protein
MIASATLEFPAAFGRTLGGESAAASFIEKEAGRFRKHYVLPRFELLSSEILSLIEEMDDSKLDREAAPVTINTVNTALKFAFLLPRSLPIPEVAADPDGEISFDWAKSQKLFSVSIGANGIISYAGRFSEKSKVHGTEQFSEAIPPEILRGIEKTTK